MFVRTYMTRDPITISLDSTYPQALSMIRKNKIRHLPVVDGSRLVGIVVEQDLLSNQPSPATTLSVYEIYSLLDSLRVRQIMTRPVITVEGDCPLEEAARIMVENKISCLPVMDGDRLVGLITQTDVFKVLVEVLGGQEDGLRLTLRLPEVVGELARVTSRIAEAGGNIVAVTSSRVMEDREREVTIKAYGADSETLKRALSDSGAVIEDMRTTSHYQPRLFE
jgi:acetoin utilization protein AcuB